MGKFHAIKHVVSLGKCEHAGSIPQAKTCPHGGQINSQATTFRDAACPELYVHQPECGHKGRRTSVGGIGQ